MQSRFLPWQPELVFSGNSYYAVDNLSGALLNQRDVWDAVADNSFPSVIPNHSLACIACFQCQSILLGMEPYFELELSGAEVPAPLPEFQC